MNLRTADRPRGLGMRILRGTPRRHRDDCIQEGWLALLTGRRPATAAKIYLRRELRHEERMTPMSQLPGDDGDDSAEASD